MAFAFLTDTHLKRYGRFAGYPTPEQLSDVFHLDANEMALLRDLRPLWDHDRLETLERIWVE